MKKLLLLTALLLVASQSFASKARLEALGQHKRGSNVIMDERIIHINPSFINKYNNFVAIELGAQNDPTVAAANDAEADPQGEGALFVAGDMLNWGFIIGNEADEANALRALTLLNSTRPMLNKVEAFVGAENVVKWGASMWYAYGKDEQTRQSLANTQRIMDQKSLGFKLGVHGDNWRFAWVQALMEKSKGVSAAGYGQNSEFKGKNLTFINGAYDFTSKLSLFAEMFNMSAEGKGTELSSVFALPSNTLTVQLDGKTKLNTMALGAGYKIHESKDINVWSEVSFNYTQWGFDTAYRARLINTLAAPLTIDTILAGSGSSYAERYVKVNMAAEARATDWLSFRGAVNQRIFGYDKNIDGLKMTKKTSRVLSAGSTFHFNKVDLDALLAAKDDGVLNFGGNILTRMALTYRF